MTDHLFRKTVTGGTYKVVSYCRFHSINFKKYGLSIRATLFLYLGACTAFMNASVTHPSHDDEDEDNDGNHITVMLPSTSIFDPDMVYGSSDIPYTSRTLLTTASGPSTQSPKLGIFQVYLFLVAVATVRNM